MPQGSINDLVQTSDGALWCASFGGLLRFDGLEFRVFDLDTLAGLQSNRITALADDNAGGLWFATQGGQLAHFREGKIVETHALEGAPDELLSLVRHPTGSLWVQGRSGAVHRLEAGQWTTPLGAGKQGQYDGLCLNRGGTISAIAEDELVTFAASGELLTRLRAPSRILALCVGSEDGLWLGLEDGVGIVHADKIDRFQLTLPTSMAVKAIIDTGAGGLWLGTESGIVHVNSSPNSPGALVDSADVLPNGVDVRALLRDHEGNLWIGSNGAGLMRLRPHRFANFGPLAWRVGVSALAEDGEGGAWVGNECKGLTHLVNGEWESRYAPLTEDENEPACIQTLLRDHAGRLWLGVGDHIVRRARDGDAKFELLLGGRAFAPKIVAIAEDAANQIWIATESGKLVCLGPEDSVRQELDLNAPVHALVAAPDEGVWVGSEGRVIHVHNGQVEALGGEANVPPGDVRDLLPEADGSVWIASYGGGLARLTDKRATRISRAQGLSDDALSRILDDGRGRLWLLSNRGLLVAEREELMAVIDGRKPKFDPVVLGPEAGVPEGNFGSPAGFRDEHRRLWFGTVGGVVRIDPGEFPFDREGPEARIERLSVDDRELPVHPRMEIPPATRRLVVEFTAFALTAPDRVHFRYRLRGFDDSWIECGTQRRAVFTALAPGIYNFEVSARNEDGVWSAAPALLPFTVLPSWWEMRWVQITAVLALAALLLALHRRRVATIHARTQRLLKATEGRARAEARESRLREELAHAGRVTTAGELATSLAHEVNQPLAAIVANAQAGRRYLSRDPLEREGLDEILRDIAQQGQRASEVIRRLREFLRKHASERSNLDLNQIVRDTLPLVRREIEDQAVQLDLELADELPSIVADAVQLQQVIVNLVKNACEALAGRPDARCIALSTRVHDGRVEMCVRDNGPGLAPEVAARLFQPYVTTKAGGMGLGLSICRSIVEAHGGRLGARPAAGGGVVFQVEFPASPEKRQDA